MERDFDYARSEPSGRATDTNLRRGRLAPFLWATAFVALGSGPAFADGDVGRGQALFARCSTCHTTNGQNRAGPSLAGIVGRKAGSVSGFRYSAAMSGFGQTWNEEKLDGFLANPREVVPGTNMAAPPVANAQDRADIIAYLRTLHTP